VGRDELGDNSASATVSGVPGLRLERSERKMEIDKNHHLAQFSDGHSQSDRIKCA